MIIWNNKETAPVDEAEIVHDDGVFTLTIGPSTSTNVECVSEGASGNVPTNVVTHILLVQLHYLYSLINTVHNTFLGNDAFTSDGIPNVRQARLALFIWWNC